LRKAPNAKKSMVLRSGALRCEFIFPKIARRGVSHTDLKASVGNLQKWVQTKSKSKVLRPQERSLIVPSPSVPSLGAVPNRPVPLIVPSPETLSGGHRACLEK